MRFEISGLIRDEPVSEGMALIECVVGKLTDHTKESFAQFATITSLLTAFNKSALFLGHCLVVFFSTGFAQVVGLRKVVAGELLRHTHHALLVHHEAVCVVEKFLCLGVEILGDLTVVLVVRVVVMHVDAHRTWAIQRENSTHIFK